MGRNRMKINRNVINIALGVMASIAWIGMSYDETGWGIGMLAGPVMIFGMIMLPSIQDIWKNRKRKNTN